MLATDKPPCPDCNRPNPILVGSQFIYPRESQTDDPFATRYIFVCECGRRFNYDVPIEDESEARDYVNTEWL
jgi:hypothetical protein